MEREEETVRPTNGVATASPWRALVGRVRWYELLPEVALVGGLAFFAIDEPDAASSAFESGRAVTLMVLTGLAWIALRVLALAGVPWPWARAAIFAAGTAVVLSVVVLPAYDDTTVIEAFPGAASPSEASARPAAASTTTTSAPDTTPAPAAVAPAVTTPPTTAPTPTTSTTTTTTVPAQPQLLAEGGIEGIDHRASGRATVYRAPDGSLVVGLEEIDIQPGPDYDVYVVPGGDRDDVDGGVRLDDLRGNIGTQFYVVAPGTDLTAGVWTVLVWCETFDVPIANATPSPV